MQPSEVEIVGYIGALLAPVSLVVGYLLGRWSVRQEQRNTDNW